jgi:hypothetical protein
MTTSNTSNTTSDADRIAALERSMRALGIDPASIPEHKPQRRVPPESIETAAVRLGVTPGELRPIVASLGARPREVTAVRQTDDGLVAEVGGVAMVLRPASAPDAAGQTGWLRLPHPSEAIEASRVNCAGSTFVRPVDDEAGA